MLYNRRALRLLPLRQVLELSLCPGTFSPQAGNTCPRQNADHK